MKTPSRRRPRQSFRRLKATLLLAALLASGLGTELLAARGAADRFAAAAPAPSALIVSEATAAGVEEPSFLREFTPITRSRSSR